jgi:hypothetical protein
VIALGCAALVVVLALAEPIVAQAQTSSRDRIPSELWRTYPLEPREGETRVRLGNEPDQPPVSRLGTGTAPAGGVEGRPSADEDGASAPPALSVFVVSLLGLVVVALVARPAVAVGRHVPGSLARFGSAVVSPVRSIGTAHPPKLGGSAFTAAVARARARSHHRTAVHRHSFGHLASRPAAAVGAALRSAALAIVSRRREILFYAFMIAVSVALGIGVTLFLSGG